MIRLVIGDLQRIQDFERRLQDVINRSNRQLQDVKFSVDGYTLFALLVFHAD
ncbi:MAG: hypothetical protein IJP68_06330 [Selenomonadaceae bacterium]|nr:hypothetical protein [Selenomonadaceae bacterium]